MTKLVKLVQSYSENAESDNKSRDTDISNMNKRVQQVENDMI